jgi:hypothetical protein
MRNEPAATLLTDAVWRGKTYRVSTPELERALTLARRNHVEGRLARAYPGPLSCVQAQVRMASQLLERNLTQVSGLLGRAGIPSALIKVDLPGECVHADFDLVVPERQWEQAAAALSGWYVYRSSYWLERTTKAHLYPLVGPALHLHAGVSWFGVPVIPAAGLLARASGNGYLVPAPADRLRIWLAHGLFQNLTLDLSELLAVRDLLRPQVIKVAREEARREGWGRAFEAAMAVAEAAIDRLDLALPVSPPVPLPVQVSLRAGAEHAFHQLREGRARLAGREAALRLPLVAAKKRKALAR